MSPYHHRIQDQGDLRYLRKSGGEKTCSTRLRFAKPPEPLFTTTSGQVKVADTRAKGLLTLILLDHLLTVRPP